jgi:hypothetical protein
MYTTVVWAVSYPSRLRIIRPGAEGERRGEERNVEQVKTVSGCELTNRPAKDALLFSPRETSP